MQRLGARPAVLYQSTSICAGTSRNCTGENMKSTFVFVLIAACCCPAVQAQESSHTGSDRLFFPSDTFWGYAQFDIAPPHNEIDPNLCAANSRIYGGSNAPCNAFARYMLSGILEVR